MIVVEMAGFFLIGVLVGAMFFVWNNRHKK